MPSLLLPEAAPVRGRRQALLPLALLLVGLAASSWLRTGVAGADGPRSIAGGLTSAAVLLLLCAAAGGLTLSRPRLGDLAVGVLGGAVLVTVPVWIWLRDDGAGLGLDGIGTWAACVVLVAVVQELYLRGVLYDAGQAALGEGATLVLTSILFGLMHVPLYGWGVLPLDMAVGLWLGWLRATTGGTAAPAAAHVIADLAGWWIR